MDIKQCRSEIDRIDTELVSLFKRRMDVALDVAKYKGEHGLPIQDPARERQVMAQAAERAGEDLERYAKVVYTALLDVSRSYQRSHLEAESPLAKAVADAVKSSPTTFPTKATVACQGVEGAYSQQACVRMFEFPSILYFQSFDGVFSAVEKGMCRYGVLPIENSAAGSVTQVYDLMERHKFHIVRGIRQRIDHALLANEGATLDGITEILSHPQGIAQCGAFLSAHPKIKVTPVENTASAAKAVAASGRTDIAAIASRRCADLYQLTALTEGVADTDNNYTRFIVIGKGMELYPGANKISMMLSLSHEPGSLSRMISRFAAQGINLTKLESRPIPGREFEFRFHFDIEASLTDPDVVKLLDEIRLGSERFTLLGNYQEGY